MFRKVATIFGSWRARLWLAREALRKKNVQSAERLCTEAISMGEPIPADLLV
jgi:hypothetical protein